MTVNISFFNKQVILNLKLRKNDAFFEELNGFICANSSKYTVFESPDPSVRVKKVVLRWSKVKNEVVYWLKCSIKTAAKHE